MDRQSIEGYVEQLRSEFGFRALVEAGAFSPLYGLYGGLEVTIQHESRRPIWMVAVSPKSAPALGFFLMPRDGYHGWLERLSWGGGTKLGDPGLDERFALRSWSKERAAALFSQAGTRSLLSSTPSLYSWRVENSVVRVGYHHQPGPPREAVAGMLEHTRALVATVCDG